MASDGQPPISPLPTDYAQAIQWFEKAADGYYKAHAKLGAMYYQGIDTPQDYVLARQ